MSAPRIIVAAVLVVAAVGAGFYFWQRSEPPYLPPPPPKPAQLETPSGPPGPQPPLHPVPEVPAPKPLPPLGASDPAMQEALASVVGAQTLNRLVNLDDLVRRIVATVDNLPRETVAQRLNPVRSAGGLLVTEGRDETLVISPANSRRYAAHVLALERVDAKKLADAYFHFYPLFQQAYIELGYPHGHFNDRLVEVIDHLLATPEVKGPIRLTTPHVLHEFADPDLQRRSAGQKALIRMGPENAARVKAKLREIRAAVARGPAPQ